MEGFPFEMSTQEIKRQKTGIVSGIGVLFSWIAETDNEFHGVYATFFWCVSAELLLRHCLLRESPRSLRGDRWFQYLLRCAE